MCILCCIMLPHYYDRQKISFVLDHIIIITDKRHFMYYSLPMNVTNLLKLGNE